MAGGCLLPRALQKLCRNGNSTSISIPRPLLAFVGWIPGQSVILDVLEDKSILVRLPVERDFAPITPSRILFTNDVPGKP